MSSSGVCAPTMERVRKAAGFDVPSLDSKRKRHTFRLIGPVETMFRAGRIRQEQFHGFKHFETDLYLTNPTASMARHGSGGGGDVEDLLCRRSDAFASLARLARYLEPRVYRSLELTALNETPLVEIGRQVLMLKNAPQARIAAEWTIQQGTWTLGVFYGCITGSDYPHLRPG